MQILSLIRDRFEKALTGLVVDPASHTQRITVARDSRHGDYQANIAMSLKAEMGLPPQQIAAEIVARLQIDDICLPPEIAGPGFINLKLRDDFLATQVTLSATDSRFGVEAIVPRRYVIDYSAPNVAKPMHVGHIRSTVIGDALVRILRFLGHRVVSDNHLGDWGTQFGMIIYGYKNFVNENGFAENPVAELSRLYRLVQQVIGYQDAYPKLAKAEAAVLDAQQLYQAANAKAASDPKAKAGAKQAAKSLRAAEELLESLQQKVSAIESEPALEAIAQNHQNLEQKVQFETAKLHAGDTTNLELWNKFLPISISEIDSVYRRLNINFDYTYGESFYHEMLEPLVSKLVVAGMAVESEGATCIFLPGFEAPMIVRKRDGAFLYATTDLATIEYRMQHFQPDVILYVVDHRQGEHFSKLFAAAKAIGYENVDLQHISFGTVLGSDGKPFKTRSGSVIGLEYLLDEAVDRAYQAVCDPQRLQKAGLNMPEEEKRHIANTVGLGAIKFADLSHNRTSDYEFNTEKMVQLEGNTSAYIQYMYARAQSIMKKSDSQISRESVAGYSVIFAESAERDLVLQLLQFEDALHQSVEAYYPSVLASYLYSVAKQFAVFFDQCPVLIASTEQLKRSRLAICFSTSEVLRLGLSLLGIGTVDRM
ncbi:MAG: arginine--tRNA ligase [Planctomycetales bacterium]|nr:arginine--tRNA ligase [Planctomycetales bacterium]